MDIEALLNEAKPFLARSVSKTGEFYLAQEYLDQLKGNLSLEQALSLYEYIRDESQRLEEEWRDEFTDAFPEYEENLPDPRC